MANQNRKFVKGFFGKEFYNNGNGNQMWDIGLNKNEFVDYIVSLPENEKGFINLTMGTQKENQQKLTLWEKEERNQSGYSTNKSATQTRTSTSQRPPVIPPKSNDNTDDLPF